MFLSRKKSENSLRPSSRSFLDVLTRKKEINVSDCKKSENVSNCTKWGANCVKLSKEWKDFSPDRMEGSRLNFLYWIFCESRIHRFLKFHWEDIWIITRIFQSFQSELYDWWVGGINFNYRNHHNHCSNHNHCRNRNHCNERNGDNHGMLNIWQMLAMTCD